MKTLVLTPEYYSISILDTLRDLTEIESMKMSRDQLMSVISNYDVILTRIGIKFDRELLEKATSLKIIATATTGTDHIDLEYAKEMGIEVISAPGVNAIATAEYTMSMILSLVRKVPWGFESIKSKEWERSKFLGNELSGKTIGIIGFGRIGGQVGRYAKSFGMNILTYDPYISKSLAEELSARIVPIDELISNSDIVTLHAFATPENENMVDANQFSKMKRSAFLINVARGSLVDEDALVEALENKKIHGAAIDVMKEEPPSENNKLLLYAKSHDNLIITPHLGGSTKEAVDNAAIYVVEKVREILKTLKHLNL